MGRKAKLRAIQWKNRDHSELGKLQRIGQDLFGSQTQFNEWLQSPSIPLGGQKPSALIKTKDGLNLVRDELGRMAHGVLA